MDKVEQIKDYIEKLKKEFYNTHDEYDGYVRNALDRVIVFIYSMQDSSKSDTQKPEKYTDVTTVTLNNEEWFKSNGYYQNRPQERKLKVGDAIVYKTKDCNVPGLMIISSFDYPADQAARAIIGRDPYVLNNGVIVNTYYGDYAPAFYLYRFATDEEIKFFFDELGKQKDDIKIYEYYIDTIKKIVPGKYDQYFT